MHLNIVKTKNAKQYYVLESYRNEQGKSSTRIVKKLGNHEQLLKEHDDPEAWARSVVDEMNRQIKEGNKKVTVSFSPSRQDRIDYLTVDICFYRSFSISFGWTTSASVLLQSASFHLILLKSLGIWFMPAS